ncbi:MAG: malonyl-ACP O-methyltransferase BioC [gamma proteobacterium symbiont of Taylorina sp.]|nr:malonyl-ACP O-methyltransferase BioC [gamma proteobacterium symbiont of Taylorina sp.]
MINKQHIRDSFNKAADSYDGAAIVQQEVCRRLLERLEYIKAKPGIILDIGSGTGQGTLGLTRQYPNASVISMDLAENMLKKGRSRLSDSSSGLMNQFKNILSHLNSSGGKRISHVCADAEYLPFADASVDLIFSNLTIQWCFDLTALFQEFRRVLKPGGFMLFTTFGTETLKELKASWSSVSNKVHVNDFADMHDIGDALYDVQAENPVMDSEKIVLNYQSIKQILLEIKAVGAHNQNNGRQAGLTGKSRLQSMYQAYEKFHTDQGYPVTYEVLYGHAWNPKTPVQYSQESGGEKQTTISLSQVKSQLKNLPYP